MRYNQRDKSVGGNISAETIRVLLADDHAVVRNGIREFLAEPGDIEVVAEAPNGAEAIALLEQAQPDVAVLDIQMPGRSGIDVCRHVRAQRWPIGILTAYDDDPYVLAVLQAGANGYVLKTADADDIIQAVRDVHEGKSAFDPVIVRKLMAQLAARTDSENPRSAHGRLARIGLVRALCLFAGRAWLALVGWPRALCPPEL